MQEGSSREVLFTRAKCFPFSQSVTLALCHHYSKKVESVRMGHFCLLAFLVRVAWLSERGWLPQQRLNLSRIGRKKLKLMLAPNDTAITSCLIDKSADKYPIFCAQLKHRTITIYVGNINQKMQPNSVEKMAKPCCDRCGALREIEILSFSSKIGAILFG